MWTKKLRDAVTGLIVALSGQVNHRKSMENSSKTIPVVPWCKSWDAHHPEERERAPGSLEAAMMRHARRQKPSADTQI